MITRNVKYDALVLGSGFAGSLLGWILAKHGWKVLLVDSAHHPRFAIGESSTPTADFLIAHLAQRWNLPELAPLACWGSWKQRYPHLVCGKKRGFSYYRHHASDPFMDDAAHSRSLLVAASSEDRWSDTHWLRSSVDHFFAQQAMACGAILWEGASVCDANFNALEKAWTVVIHSGEETPKVQSRWLLDASGGAVATAQFTMNPRDDQWMRTRTRATFAHYVDVKPFAAGASADDPFSGDDAAQHHVFDDGWCWMLRMDQGITSVGVVETMRATAKSEHPPVQARKGNMANRLEAKINRYPSVAAIMANARLIAPQGGPVGTNRLSRCRSRAHGDAWVLLPSTYGFVDPLHSTGIAHSLSGVARIAEALLGQASQRDRRLARYATQLRREIHWIDTLVAGCYRALPSFPRFIAFASFYFAAAVQFEAAMASDPLGWPNGFLHCDDPEFERIVEESFLLLTDHSISDDDFVRIVRQRIAPWNTVGLLEPDHRNRLHHTSAPKHAAWE